MLEVSYYKAEETGLMVVTLHALKQTIVLQPGYFYKIAGVSRNVVVGFWEMDVNTLIDLGFVFPSRFGRKIG